MDSNLALHCPASSYSGIFSMTSGETDSRWVWRLGLPQTIRILHAEVVTLDFEHRAFPLLSLQGQ